MRHWIVSGFSHCLNLCMYVLHIWKINLSKILTEHFKETAEMGVKNKGPIQQSPLPFKYATKIHHKNVTWTLGWVPNLLKRSFGICGVWWIYYIFGGNSAKEAHNCRLSSYLFNNKGVKINVFSLVKMWSLNKYTRLKGEKLKYKLKTLKNRNEKCLNPQHDHEAFQIPIC